MTEERVHPQSGRGAEFSAGSVPSRSSHIADASLDLIVREWVRSVDPTAEISFSAPTAAQAGRGVSVYLLELAPHPSGRGASRSPLGIWLRYLVTTWADGVADAHDLLLDLAFAAMDRTDLEVDAEPLAAGMWAALNAIPQPSFMIRIAARRERPEPAVKPVLLPLRIEGGDMGVIAGVVLDPEDRPIAGATVFVPGVDRAAETDRRGRFDLRGVPAYPATKAIRVRAKGRETEVAVPPDRDLARSMVIHVNPLGREHA
jgi:Carboxypeptidase regulatory-like domain